jgi:hypothetical protein
LGRADLGSQTSRRAARSPAPGRRSHATPQQHLRPSRLPERTALKWADGRAGRFRSRFPG